MANIQTTYENLLPFDPNSWRPEANPEYMSWIERVVSSDAFRQLHGRYQALDIARQWYFASMNCCGYALGDRECFAARALGALAPGSLFSKTIRQTTIQFPMPDGQLQTVSTVDLIKDRKFHVLAASIPSVAQQLLVLDGLRSTGSEINHEVDSRPIALFILLGQDFHFMRLDQEGWSHKLGNVRPEMVIHNDDRTPVTDPRKISLLNLDPSGQGFGDTIVVRNENQNELARHYNFVGFFNVPHNLSFPIETALEQLEARKMRNPRGIPLFDECYSQTS